jgi:hypothetical protein
VDLERRAKLQTVGGTVAAIVLVAAGGWLLGKFLAADDDSQSEAAATTTTAPADPKAEVEQAYRAYNAMVDRLFAAPDPDDPQITQLATGDARDQLVSALSAFVATGDVAHFGPTRSLTILTIDVSGDEATVRACFVDESGRYDAATGEAIEPMRVATIVDTTSLVRHDGIWQVSFVKDPGADEQWLGVHECAT